MKTLLNVPYEEKEIARQLGAMWDATLRKWYVNSDEAVVALEKYADISDVEISRKRIQEKESNISNKGLPPCLANLYDFQKKAVKFARNKNSVLLADEMGLGKTAQAIGICMDKKLDTVLTVCPASLKELWRREWKTWGGEMVSVIDSDSDLLMLEKKKIVINYDILYKFSNELKARKWDAIIYDEAHYIKNRKAHRTKIAVTIDSFNKIFISGTPLLNRPIELYTMLNMAGVSIAQNWKSYVIRYCDAFVDKFGWNTDGASNTKELNKHLQGFMLRRKKDEVMSQLPAKTRQNIVISGYDAIADAEILAVAKIRRAKARGIAGEYRAEFAELSRARHDTGLAKVDATIDAIIAANLAKEKVVVFAHHKDVIDMIADAMDKYGMYIGVITGDTSLDDRQRLVDEFQSGKLECMIGSIGAMGVGLTLTVARMVIFCELDWTPARLEQAEDRVHRISQSNSVLIQYIVLKNSIDAMMLDLLEGKSKTILEIIDGIET